MSTRREILAHEVADKLRLEALVKPGIRKIFARAADDFRVSVARTGQSPDTAKYRTSFESLLDEHYRRVQKSFSGAVLLQNDVHAYSSLRQIKAAKDEDETHTKELIAAIFLLWREEHAPDQADIIVGTTSRDMGDAIGQARQALTEQGKPTDNRSLAATATAILKRILRGRVDLIAITETQAAAEATKAIEVSAATGVRIPGIPTPADTSTTDSSTTRQTQQANALKKSWLDMRDKRVRHTHLEAGRTYGATPISLDQAFIVGGSRMMFPGDTSLGAPVREIANCRCSARYSF